MPPLPHGVVVPRAHGGSIAPVPSAAPCACNERDFCRNAASYSSPVISTQPAAIVPNRGRWLIIGNPAMQKLHDRQIGRRPCGSTLQSPASWRPRLARIAQAHAVMVLLTDPLWGKVKHEHPRKGGCRSRGKRYHEKAGS